MLRPASRPRTRRSSSGGSVCNTCLSATELYSLQNTPQYLDICNGLSLSKADMICYGCRDTLSSFYKFRVAARRAQQMLSGLSDRCRTMHRARKRPCIECLSTLSQTTRSKDEEAVEIEGVKEEILESTFKSEMPMPLERDDDGLKMESEAADVFYEHVKSELADDDSSRTDTASECEDDVSKNKVLADESVVNSVGRVSALAAQGSTETDSTSKDEGVNKKLEESQEFKVKRIALPEVQAYYERKRRTLRFKRARYKCVTCAHVFVTEQLLNAHNRRHSEAQGRFKCTICEHRFAEKKDLMKHTDEHFRRFECFKCPHVEYTYRNMYSHYLRSHDDTLRFCKHCSARFTSMKELMRHARSAHGQKLPCHLCHLKFPYEKALKNHLELQHSKVPIVECEICHRKYKGQKNLQKHMAARHDDLKKPKPSECFYCAECDKQFKDIYVYRVHLKRTSKHATKEEYKYECDYCHKKFVDKPHVRSHIELKHMRISSRYKCEVCGETFPAPAYLARHRRVKHRVQRDVNKYYCHVCGKEFTIRKSLNEHINTHFGIRPYICKVCGATFTYSASLFTHNRLVHLKWKKGKSGKT